MLNVNGKLLQWLPTILELLSFSYEHGDWNADIGDTSVDLKKMDKPMNVDVEAWSKLKLADGALDRLGP